MSEHHTIRAGDSVKHIPTGETWLVVAVSGNDLMPYGWPETTAKVSDCEVIGKCSDAEHEKAVRDWLKDRGHYDRRVAINKDYAVKLGIAEFYNVDCTSCGGSGKRLDWRLKITDTSQPVV